jgi:hypothetical protein
VQFENLETGIREFFVVEVKTVFKFSDTVFERDF